MWFLVITSIIMGVGNSNGDLKTVMHPMNSEYECASLMNDMFGDARVSNVITHGFDTHIITCYNEVGK